MPILVRPRRPKPPCFQTRLTAERATTILDAPEMPAVARADRELKRRVVNYLHLRQVLDIQELKIHAQQGQVTVQGKLPSPQAKRLCLECCRRVAGVLQLIDELAIAPIR
jgi:osmotically-inducible protein OsmY